MPRRYRTYTPEELTIWIRAMIAHGDTRCHGFYISHAWLHIRADVIREHKKDGCVLCKAKGSYAPATMVHHIKTVRAAPWLALTKSNLMPLCDDCHYDIHHPHKPQWDDERW